MKLLLQYLATVVIFLATLLMAVPAHAEHHGNKIDNDYKPTAEQIVIDGLIYRPLALAGTVIGTGIFIVTLPFSLFSGNIEDVGNTLIIEPAHATFDHCLGCITDYTGSWAR